MTEDELIERALRAEGVFPPSVMDCHYSDKTEMTRGEIILRSLDETGLLPLPEHDAQCASRIRCIHFVIAELQGRLPDDGKITTCGAFRDLAVGCCDRCHTNPVVGMNLVELLGGT